MWIFYITKYIAFVFWEVSGSVEIIQGPLLPLREHNLHEHLGKQNSKIWGLYSQEPYDLVDEKSYIGTKMTPEAGSLQIQGFQLNSNFR